MILCASICLAVSTIAIDPQLMRVDAIRSDNGTHVIVTFARARYSLVDQTLTIDPDPIFSVGFE